MSKKHKAGALEPCPCGSGRSYAQCCAPWHGGVPAPTPEALMRSRYSAYALGLADYLLASWHAGSRPETLDLADPPTKWIGLQVLGAQMQDASHGTVEFVARCRINGRAERMHELSRFVKEDERWYYVDGDFPGAA